jgi:hypothetical protein
MWNNQMKVTEEFYKTLKRLIYPNIDERWLNSIEDLCLGQKQNIVTRKISMYILSRLPIKTLVWVKNEAKKNGYNNHHIHVAVSNIVDDYLKGE